MIQGEISEWIDLGIESIGVCKLKMQAQVLKQHDTRDNASDYVPTVRYWIVGPNGKYLTGCPAAPFSHVQTIYKSEVLKVAKDWLQLYHPDLLQLKITK